MHRVRLVSTRISTLTAHAFRRLHTPPHPLERHHIETGRFLVNTASANPLRAYRAYHTRNHRWKPMTLSGGTVACDHPRIQPIYTKELDHLATLFKGSGYELRLVGGAVRDILSGEVPHDIDLASNATPEEAMALLNAACVRVVETGLQHGTVMAVINKISFEITTLRIDELTDGRHAKVKYTKDWQIDAMRRDLTINAMSIALDTGELYDYFGGVEDLEKKIVRFVGNAEDRIREDYLRILRFFRFLGRISGSMEHTQDLKPVFRSTASGLDAISGERIWKEFKQTIVLNQSHIAVKIMMDCGVGQAILLPATCNTGELERVLDHTRDEAVLLASLFDNLDDFMLMADRWKLPKLQFDLAQFVIKNRGQSMGLHSGRRKLSDSAKQIRHVHRQQLVETLRYDGNVADAEKLQAWDVPTFPVTGGDLKAVGVPFGKGMGALIHQLRGLWKAADFEMSKEQLLEEAKKTLS